MFHAYIWHDYTGFLDLGQKIASARGLNKFLVEVAPQHKRVRFADHVAGESLSISDLALFCDDLTVLAPKQFFVETTARHARAQFARYAVYSPLPDSFPDLFGGNFSLSLFGGSLSSHFFVGVLGIPLITECLFSPNLDP